jgi:steroid delta-isomerase-like uncharacterized protein
MKSLVLVLVLIAFYGTGCESHEKGDMAMLIPEGDRIIQMNICIYIDSVYNGQDTTFLGHLITDNFRRNSNGVEIKLSAREMGSYLQVFFTAFPDMNTTVEESFIKDSKAFIVWNTAGTNTGTFGEMVATGKKVVIHGMSHLYFNEQGKIYREHVFFNELDLLQQLGFTLIPPELE